MNEKTNIIAIYSIVESTPLPLFAKTGKYKSFPMILYKVNDEQVRYFAVDRPIEIIREDMYYNNINNSFDENDISFLSMPSDAYDKIRNYVNRNINKVVADMITHVVTQIIKDCNISDENCKNIFFIDSTDFNKIIGRLGYLYLDSKKNNIAFITYKSRGLMTDVLNSGNEKLKFDINHFKNISYHNNNYSDIIPNDFMESMTQTVFYKMETKEGELSPIRCDIFSQGTSQMEIRNKAEDIEKILTNQDLMTPAFQENESSDIWIMIPRVLKECHDAKDLYKMFAGQKLEE